jgi:hypothetical protein
MFKGLTNEERKYPSTMSLKSIGFNSVQKETFVFMVGTMEKEELLFLREEIRKDIKNDLLKRGAFKSDNPKVPKNIQCLEYMNNILEN